MCFYQKVSVHANVNDVNTSLGWSFLAVLVKVFDLPMLGLVIVTLTHS